MFNFKRVLASMLLLLVSGAFADDKNVGDITTTGVYPGKPSGFLKETYGLNDLWSQTCIDKGVYKHVHVGCFDRAYRGYMANYYCPAEYDSLPLTGYVNPSYHDNSNPVCYYGGEPEPEPTKCEVGEITSHLFPSKKFGDFYVTLAPQQMCQNSCVVNQVTTSSGTKGCIPFVEGRYCYAQFSVTDEKCDVNDDLPQAPQVDESTAIDPKDEDQEDGTNSNNCTLVALRI